MRLFPRTARVPEGDAIPHEVVGLTIKKGFTLARAWREYLGLTQKEVAGRMGITQAALSQMEVGGKRLRKATNPVCNIAYTGINFLFNFSQMRHANLFHHMGLPDIIANTTELLGSLNR